MTLAIFNPEHDLCLAKGRAHYVPPRSAVDFARRDAQAVMGVLYPDAICSSVYDLPSLLSGGQAISPDIITVWGWDAVVRHELKKRGVPARLLPTDEEINTIRELQHRSTILPLQPDCHAVASIEDMEKLLREREHWVMKAPWSGAGRGLRWVHGSMTAIDHDWLLKTVASQRCVIAEPRRDVLADVALEFKGGVFTGYSYFKTRSGVYKENVMWSDDRIESIFSLKPVRDCIGQWLTETIWPRYSGPLGVDLMVCEDGSVHVSEINLRHTMGMVAHAKINVL